MKNREKFAKEILDIACKGSRIAIKHDCVIPCVCSKIECSDCQFDFYDDCEEGIENWCESEYVEKPTITSREKNFLDVLLPSCKYIARGKNNLLYVYHDKPIRGNVFWISDYASHDMPKDMYGDVFSFIKWEDEEPWSIEDLKKLEVKDE